MTNLPPGWILNARGPDADRQCWIEIISPTGDSSSFSADADTISGRIVAQLAEANAATLETPSLPAL